MMKPLTIGEIARQAAVGIETVRFYERRGLIEQPPKPNGAGFRTYPQETVKRLRFIQQAQDIGFSLREIHELLALKTDPESDCGDVKGRAVAKLKEVHDKIGKLRRIGEALEALIAVCPGCGPVNACSILEALDDSPSQAPAPPEPSLRKRELAERSARSRQGRARNKNATQRPIR
ncbi:DNA-binding transcriptional activator of copper-responsive regulon genes [Hyphomicrobium denitrificans 1NES1]|uniref:DNA-binding transcriptional activator of copper-responsive regulon genes n=1 Tax=Hyphomicrobium denitrificans 1NES1 TaxID=670307 RepID=N0B0Y6_9HYPH|nr:MerR family DNA-binding protein [Hyphomicrobium denitrificans]AGK57124.1 DNA-binding transcriptional activator of copper-responsive regulon genes [Hyphomicrobium denitrificans 1NES1]